MYNFLKILNRLIAGPGQGMYKMGLEYLIVNVKEKGSSQRLLGHAA